MCEQSAASLDLLVTDVVLPRLSGPRLAERLTASRPGLRVLYPSGAATGGDAAVAELPAEANLLRKPFAPVDLLRAVRSVLDGRGAGPAKAQ